MRRYISGLLLILGSALFAQDPVVENVRFEQRTDGTLLVDIYYDVTDEDGSLLQIVVDASDNDGETWTLPCKSLSGDVGVGIASGTNKHIEWDFYEDNPDTSGYGYRIRVTANQIISDLLITKDFTLTHDILCTLPDGVVYACALKIGAPNITLDLGGYTILGDLSNGYIEGVLVEDYDGITIRNGTIENFGIAIVMSRSNNIMIENMTIKNLVSDDPVEFFNGIVIGEGQDVVVRDSYFEFLPVMHKEAVIMANCNFIVNNCEFKDGSVGVNFGGEGPSNGLVINNKFNGVGAGILFQNSTAGQIRNNVFSENGIGVMADPAYLGCIKGLTIDGNEIKDGGTGIYFYGTVESSITNNIVKNNGHRGITLMPNMECTGEESCQDCFYSTANVITDNEVIDNFIDLYHHEKCTGNTWERNKFYTKQGVEIPECNAITATAREALTYIDSAAADVAEDAQLLSVFSGPCDTIGKSYKWLYIYESASQQSNYEFWFRDGHIIKLDFITPYMINENNLPIPETWIDSDSAMVVADGLGGKEFSEKFEIQTIQMDLINTWGAHWNVHYISRDTTFSIYFDASME